MLREGEMIVCPEKQKEFLDRIRPAIEDYNRDQRSKKWLRFMVESNVVISLVSWILIALYLIKNSH